MDAVRQRCRPKHQVLVLRCYPKHMKNNMEVKPNSSELNYLLYYATVEGMSLKPRQSTEPALRLSVARGIGTVADRDTQGWKADLAMMAAQLQVMVVARFADGSVGPASRRFSAGEM